MGQNTDSTSSPIDSSAHYLKQEIQNNKSDCYQDMRTGTFSYTTKNNQEITITRTEKKQTEVHGDFQTEMAISWTNDSIYALTILKNDFSGCLKKGDVLTVSIKSCEQNKYSAYYTTVQCGYGSSVFTKKK